MLYSENEDSFRFAQLRENKHINILNTIIIFKPAVSIGLLLQVHDIVNKTRLCLLSYKNPHYRNTPRLYNVAASVECRGHHAHETSYTGSSATQGNSASAVMHFVNCRPVKWPIEVIQGHLFRAWLVKCDILIFALSVKVPNTMTESTENRRFRSPHITR